MTTLGKLVAGGLLALIVLVGAGVYYLAHRAPEVRACTMEAKICPDGTAVGRTGPDCSFAPCPAPSVSLSSDVHPLYSAATWQSPTSASFKIGTTTFSGVIATSTPSASTDNIISIAQPFVDYYNAKLTSEGYKEVSWYDADGAGGSLRSYFKGAQMVQIGYSSDFSNISEDVPAQCPCTVSFSVFTGGVSTSTSR